MVNLSYLRQLFVCYFGTILKAKDTGHNFCKWLFLRRECHRENNRIYESRFQSILKWRFLNAESTLVVILFIDLLWTSPERLRLRVLPSFGHYQQSDIYSLAIVMHELFERTGPFGVETIQIQPYGEYVNKPTV